MNFRTRQSYNNRLLFVYADGNVKQTSFIEVAYYGDDYVLAKDADDIFYNVLDLDGNTVEDTRVIHRFQNGMLLTYSAFSKNYKSSDSFAYDVNYNVYSVLNYTTGKSTVVSVVQSDNLLNVAENEALRNKCRKVVVKDFLNRPVYCFKDFVFSEIMDYQYMMVGSYFNLTSAGNQNFDFDTYKTRKIWGIADVSKPAPFTKQTTAENVVSKVTFKEAELELMSLTNEPEKPFAEDFETETVFADAKEEYVMHNTWRKRNRWQMLLAKVLPSTVN